MDAPKPKCAGKSKRSGKQCKRDPAIGLDKCAIHCGLSKAERDRAAAEHKARQQARKAVETYGLPLDISPAEALLEEVRYTAGHVVWLRGKVHEIEDDDLVWGKTEAVEKNASEFAGTDTTYAATPSVWLELYYRERKHLVDVTKAAISAGIEERRVKLAEAQGAMLAQVIRAILGDLDLTAEQQAKVAVVVPRRLRAVDGKGGAAA
jgi:hypothetical protein